MQKNYLALAAVAILLLLAGCKSQTARLEDLAKEELQKDIAGRQLTGYIKITRIVKTNGREVDGMGMKGYQVQFNVEFDVLKNIYSYIDITDRSYLDRLIGMGLLQKDSSYNIIYGKPSLIPAGKHFKMMSETLFVKTDNGWEATTQ